MKDNIDRQTAIDALEKDKTMLDLIVSRMSADNPQLDHYVAMRNQVAYDINTIKLLPAQPVEPEIIRCKDCKYYNEYFVKCNHPHNLGLRYIKTSDDFCSAAKALEEAPTVEPAKGKWNTYYHSDIDFSYSCNQCGYSAPFQMIGGKILQKKWNYCPNCGVKMEG